MAMAAGHCREWLPCARRCDSRILAEDHAEQINGDRQRHRLIGSCPEGRVAAMVSAHSTAVAAAMRRLSDAAQDPQPIGLTGVRERATPGYRLCPAAFTFVESVLGCVREPDVRRRTSARDMVSTSAA